MPHDRRKNDTAHHEPERRVGDRRRLSDRRKDYRNYGTPWTEEQIQLLKSLISQEIPLRRLAQILGRTSSAVDTKVKQVSNSDKKVA
ncbi:MAG TPA: hypothetical protein VHB01_08855 [Nitrosospira sp.]|jgi:hypothetical protein|nr:hypothetical protein [Nitrosospira sp.]